MKKLLIITLILSSFNLLPDREIDHSTGDLTMSFYKHEGGVGKVKVNGVVVQYHAALLPDKKTAIIYVYGKGVTAASYVVNNYPDKEGETWHEVEVYSTKNHFFGMKTSSGDLKLVYRGKSRDYGSEPITIDADNSLLILYKEQYANLIFKGAGLPGNEYKLLQPTRENYLFHKKSSSGSFRFYMSGNDITMDDETIGTYSKSDAIVYVGSANKNSYLIKNAANAPVNSITKATLLCGGSNTFCWRRVGSSTYNFVYRGAQITNATVKPSGSSGDMTVHTSKGYGVLKGAAYSPIDSWQWSSFIN